MNNEKPFRNSVGEKEKLVCLQLGDVSCSSYSKYIPGLKENLLSPLSEDICMQTATMAGQLRTKTGTLQEILYKYYTDFIHLDWAMAPLFSTWEILQCTLGLIDL